jgi:hypothetical protein
MRLSAFLRFELSSAHSTWKIDCNIVTVNWVIGSTNYKEEYCNEKVNKWREEVEALSDIAKSQPHSAYVAFTKGVLKIIMLTPLRKPLVSYFSQLCLARKRLCLKNCTK